MTASPRQSGFSLVELIIVVVIVGILAGGAGLLIVQPIEAYEDQVRRQQLVDQGEMALRQIARDVRGALPNSLRVSGSSVELVPVVDGARYRDEHPAGTMMPDDADVLDFVDPMGDDQFNLLGGIINDMDFDPNYRIVIYNTSVARLYSDAFFDSNPGIITPAGTMLGWVDDGGNYPDEDRISLSSPFRFEQQSPGQRLFFVDRPISYECDTGTGEILRHSGYNFSQFQDPTPTMDPEPVITGLSSCVMTYAAGTSQRAGVLTVEIGIADSGETITLLHQIHVVNVP